MKQKMYRKTVPYLFLLPYFIFFLVFMLYPIIFSLGLSFGKYKAGDLILTGFNNFRYILSDPLFYKALKNTFVMMLIQVPLMTIIALLLACCLNKPNVIGTGVFRMLVFMPILMDSVSYSIVFGNFFNKDNGFINNFIRALGGEGLAWLSVGWLAKMVLVVMITWKWTGYNTVILLSGLQAIPHDLYEAASIDGATKLTQFLHVTVPGIKPVLLFSVVNSVNGMLQLFTESYLLTAGGPVNETLTIVQYLYSKGFKSFDFGAASAGSYVLVIIIGILTYIQLRVTRED